MAAPGSPLAGLGGLPETALPAGVLDRLPASVPPPPWRLRARALMWVSRARPPLPAGSPLAARTLPVTVAALIDYLDSPVGPYREVFAAVLLRGLGLPRLHVPFIAVDSLPSLRAGREHWSLPKTLAGFDGDPRDRIEVRGEGWSVRAEAGPYGRWLPVVGAFRSVQAGRQAMVTVRGTGRPARVTVAATGPTLTGWLGTGRHAGFLTSGTLVVHPGRPGPASWLPGVRTGLGRPA